MEPKYIDCGESGTTVRIAIGVAASGKTGDGIFVFTGQGRLPFRGYRDIIDFINREAVNMLVHGASFFNHLSIAVPANGQFHMPITVYVGNEACNQLNKEINEGKYAEFDIFK